MTLGKRTWSIVERNSLPTGRVRVVVSIRPGVHANFVVTRVASSDENIAMHVDAALLTGKFDKLTNGVYDG